MNRIILFVLLLSSTMVFARQSNPVEDIRSFCIAAPHPDDLDRFLEFMENDLAGNGINVLILRIDYNYEYESYPNLRSSNPLTKKDVTRMVKLAKQNGMRLIPQVNLFGHQSWHGSIGNLLREYPEFDETPHVQLPEQYKWPNEDGLYCKSYCPLHPQVHKVVFAIVDEITEAFEADAFHAGMDEVFYIGDDQCPRCWDKDHSELFAGEVKRIHGHLAGEGKELWIWGDRLIDGKTSGLGLWEASENDTHRAIDMIPKDVVICDWHYENADPTTALFALKGFRVIICFYDKPGVARAHLEMMQSFRANSKPVLAKRFCGSMQTIWTPAGRFLDGWNEGTGNEGLRGQVESYREMIRYYRENE